MTLAERQEAKARWKLTDGATFFGHRHARLVADIPLLLAELDARDERDRGLADELEAGISTSRLRAVIARLRGKG